MDAFETDPGQIALRLGVTEELVRHLQERGVLRRFDLSENEVRTRICDGQARHRTAETTDRPTGWRWML
jgi:hypothetical protein